MGCPAASEVFSICLFPVSFRYTLSDCIENAKGHYCVLCMHQHPSSFELVLGIWFGVHFYSFRMDIVSAVVLLERFKCISRWIPETCPNRISGTLWTCSKHLQRVLGVAYPRGKPKFLKMLLLFSSLAVFAETFLRLAGCMASFPQLGLLPTFKEEQFRKEEVYPAAGHQDLRSGGRNGKRTKLEGKEGDSKQGCPLRGT